MHSQPRKEDLLWHQIQLQGFETFYPRLKVHPVNPRSKKIRAYFPGYLFVHVDLSVTGTSTFQWMPYGTGLVSFGGEPAVVPDALINAIRSRVGEIAEAGGELFAGIKPGDTIQIRDGPFSGYEAIFDTRLPGSERVRVLLKMLNQRRLPIELEAGLIQPKRPPRPR